jgi:hypothetical protein
MKTEMDVLDMDERQRLNWLKANRATLMIVGVIWLGMIAYELVSNNLPVFLIVMVPVFALTRFVAYRIYARAA